MMTGNCISPDETDYKSALIYLLFSKCPFKEDNQTYNLI